MEEGLQFRTFQDAVAGKRLAQREVLRWIGKREAWLAKYATKDQPKEAGLRISRDPRNANEALVLLGVAAADPAYVGSSFSSSDLLLQPWAVQAALAKRRGSKKLLAEEISQIKGQTRDPHKVRWRGSLKHD